MKTRASLKCYLMIRYIVLKDISANKAITKNLTVQDNMIQDNMIHVISVSGNETLIDH